MTTRPLRGLLALAALLIVSACAERTTTTALLRPHPSALTQAQWDEATAQQTMAPARNTSMIAMR